jgi:photosystem II stability/assembly factor-like uncharacterized protein
MQQPQTLSKPSFKLPFQRVLAILFSISAVLTMAQACNIPGLGNRNSQNTQKANLSLGIIKHTTLANGQKGFARANAGNDENLQTQQQLLTQNSVIKIQRVSKDELFILTPTRGLFKSENAGAFWNRVYILPVNTSKIPQKSSLSTQEIAETTKILAPNNKLVIRDFVVSPIDPNIIFVAGQQDGLGKIFRSTNGGQSFEESYSEVQNNTAVNFLSIYPNNTRNIYAYTAGSNLIQSNDLGQTWTKIKDFRSKPVQFGFIAEESNLFYTIFKENGFNTSVDGGLNWKVANIFKDQESSNTSSKSNKNPGNFSFAVQDKVAQGGAGWLLVANNRLWYTSNLNQEIEEVSLPFESQAQNITAIAIDPVLGKQRMLIAIGKDLFETLNAGESWQKKDITIEGELGNISNIVIEPTNTQDYYLTLINPELKRVDGIYQ